MQAPPRPRSPWAIYLKLIGGWLIAASVAVGNHFFFAMLDGRNTREFKDILITTIKNALAAVVQLTLVSVQGVAIVQIVRLLNSNSLMFLTVTDDRHGPSFKEKALLSENSTQYLHFRVLLVALSSLPVLPLPHSFLSWASPLPVS